MFSRRLREVKDSFFFYWEEGRKGGKEDGREEGRKGGREEGGREGRKGRKEIKQ